SGFSSRHGRKRRATWPILIQAMSSTSLLNLPDHAGFLDGACPYPTFRRTTRKIPFHFLHRLSFLGRDRPFVHADRRPVDGKRVEERCPRSEPGCTSCGRAL